MSLSFTDNQPDKPKHPLVPPRKAVGRQGVEPALIPARPDLEQFRENLVRGMIKKNMTASDVARAMWGSTTNAQGNSVARGRDRMTHYLSGSTYPNPENITKLCEILDLKPEDLAIDTSKSGQPRPTAQPPAPRAATTGYEKAPEPGIHRADELTFTMREAGYVDITFRRRMTPEQAFAWLDLTRRLVLDNVTDAETEATTSPPTPASTEDGEA